MITFKLIKIVRPSSLILVYVLMIGIATAESLPSHYPNKFSWSGVVQGLTADRVLIADREFSLRNGNVSFHQLKSFNSTINDIDKGMIVGCIMSNSNELVSIWQLPDSFEDRQGTGLSRGIK